MLEQVRLRSLKKTSKTMGWNMIARSTPVEEDELREAYEEGCEAGYRKGWKAAEKKMRGGGMDDDDDDYGERGGGYGERGGYGGMDMMSDRGYGERDEMDDYGERGGGYGGRGGYGERRGVRGTGPYSRVTRAGYVRRRR